MAFELAGATEILRRTPDVLRAQLADLGEGWTTARRDPESWSAYGVVAHFAYIEEFDWLVRARIIAEEGTTRPFPPLEHSDQSDRFAGMSLGRLLDRFAELRATSLRELAPLVASESQLDLRGRHPDLGEVTMRQLLATWVVHDLNHLRQVDEALAARYDAEVGPWRSMLGILPQEPMAEPIAEGVR